jgi:hypothetical protein
MHVPKAKMPEIKLVDEEVDHPHRVVLGDIVRQLRRKHRSLIAIRPAYKAGHAISLLFAVKILRQNQFSTKPDFSHSLGLFPKIGCSFSGKVAACRSRRESFAKFAFILW